MSIFEELKRRNVVKMAMLYGVVSWLILQVADILFDVLELPPTWVRLVLAVLVLGFPITLILSWVYEMTPEGLKREKDVDRDKSVTQETGRKINILIVVLLVVAIAAVAVDRVVPRGTSIAESRERSVAVLPFVTRSSKEQDIFFVDGIHDDILTQLARIGSMKVISRTSVEQFRNPTQSMKEIGDILGVRNILEGGVQRSGDRVRINMQLIDTRTDEHIWAQTYDKEITVESLFEIQTEITREIVAALNGVLSEQDTEALDSMPTTSLEAYAEYVRGRSELAKRTGASLRSSKVHFENAIELDSQYALAYVGLADVYALLPEYGGVVAKETWVSRQAALDKALSINPHSGEAYTNLASLRSAQGEMEAAETYYLRAIELNPNYPTAYHWYHILLRDARRYEEAHTQLLKAIELDPLAPVLIVNLSIMQQILGHSREAKETLLTGLKRNRDYPGYYQHMAFLLNGEGRLGEALKWSQKAAARNPSSPSIVAFRCYCYLEIGDDETAESCYSQFDLTFPENIWVAPVLVYYYRSQFEEALGHLRRRAQRRPDDVYLAWLYSLIDGVGEAKAIVEGLEPELFSDADVVVNFDNLFAVFIAANSLYVDGAKDRANYLFDQALDAMQSMHRSGPIGYGRLDVFIHAARGERQLAILALKESVNAGYRAAWWELRSPHFASMRGEPDWIELVNQMEAEVALQRQWYENHKDEPLF